MACYLFASSAYSCAAFSSVSYVSKFEGLPSPLSTFTGSLELVSSDCVGLRGVTGRIEDQIGISYSSKAFLASEVGSSDSSEVISSSSSKFSSFDSSLVVVVVVVVEAVSETTSSSLPRAFVAELVFDVG